MYNENPDLDWTDVRSSCIESVKYDGGDMTLTVRFHSGNEYEYYPITRDEVDNLIKASSVGSYFNGNIKGTYQERKA